MCCHALRYDATNAPSTRYPDRLLGALAFVALHHRRRLHPDLEPELSAWSEGEPYAGGASTWKPWAHLPPTS